MKYSPNSLGHYMNYLSLDFARRTAMTFVGTKERRDLTYADLLRLTQKISLFLLNHGVGKGDRIIIHAKNCPEWVAVLFSCAATGIVLVPVDYYASQNALLSIIDDTSPKYVISDSADTISALNDSIPCLHIDRLREAVAPYDENQLGAYDYYISGDDVVEIVYTLGTSGKPKAVLISNRNIVANILALRSRVLYVPSWCFLSLLPLSHMMEQIVGCLCVLRFGGRVVYTEKRDFTTILQTIKDSRITTIAITPQVLFGLCKKFTSKLRASGTECRIDTKWRFLAWLPFPARRLLTLHLRRKLGLSLQSFICGGAPLMRTLEDFWETIGIRIVQGYGLTEATAIVACNSYDHRVGGSVGMPLRGQHLKLAEGGEIHIAGENVARGYFKQPDLTRRSFHDEWLRTGDLGRMDDRGNLYIVGKIDDAP